MATTLTDAPSYTIDVPQVGRVTYHRGEELAAGHIGHVPDEDRALFEINGGPSKSRAPEEAPEEESAGSEEDDDA